VKLTTDLHLVPRPRVVELYLHSPICLHGIVLNLIKHKNNFTFIGFEVLTAVVMKSTIFWEGAGVAQSV
jgi:hypothetical protein